MLMLNDVYLRFMDYVKLFDKIRQKDLFELLDKLDLFGKYIRIISNIYREQTPCIGMRNELNNYAKIKRKM